MYLRNVFSRSDQLSGPLWRESFNGNPMDDSPHKEPVMWSFDILLFAWISGWTNNRFAGDLKSY